MLYTAHPNSCSQAAFMDFQLTKYCNLIGGATIVAMTQVVYVIVTRLLYFALRSDYARQYMQFAMPGS